MREGSTAFLRFGGTINNITSSLSFSNARTPVRIDVNTNVKNSVSRRHRSYEYFYDSAKVLSLYFFLIRIVFDVFRSADRTLALLRLSRNEISNILALYVA